MYVFTAVLVAFKRAALPGYFQSNRRVLWVKRKKKSDHTSIQHPSCVFFPFFSLTRLLFTCPLLTRCWSHNGTDVYMYTHGRTQPHKRRREPTSTHKKILLLLFISSWRRIYLSIYIYTYKYNWRATSIGILMPRPPFLPRALIPPTLMISSNNWRWQRKTGLPMQKWGWSVVFLCFILYTLFHHSGLLFFFFFLCSNSLCGLKMPSRVLLSIPRATLTTIDLVLWQQHRSHWSRETFLSFLLYSLLYFRRRPFKNK